MHDLYANIDELLAKNLAGESTPEEDTVIRGWLQSTPDNTQYFDELRRLWRQIPESRSAPVRVVDTEAALLRVKGALNAPPVAASRPTVKRFPMYYGLAAAAALLLLLAVVWVFQRPVATPLEVYAGAVMRTDTLADGSEVSVQPNSSLSVAPDFNRRERRMKLRGEAYFEVQPDANRPFVVEIQDLEVKVVGTAFNVNNFTDGKYVVITVTEGRVLLSARGQSLLLEKGQEAVYETETGEIKPSDKPDENVAAFKNRMFVFDTPIAEIFRRVGNAYGVEIVVEDESMKQCRWSTKFPNITLQEIFNLAEETHNFRVEKTTDTSYILKGGKCERQTDK
jgi:transmembrane sensor